MAATSPLRSSPRSATTPANPTPRPASRRVPSGSCAPVRRERRAPRSGTEATSRPDRVLLMRRSASESSHQGRATSTRVKRRIDRQRGRSARRLPFFITAGSSSNAPRAVRRKTRLAGVNSRTATLMSRYGMPQITDSARKSNQPLRVTRATSWGNRFGDPLRWPGDANVSAAPGSPGRFFQRHEDGSAGAFALEEFADCLHHQIVIVLLRKPRHGDRADTTGVLHEYGEAAAMRRECLRRNSHLLGEHLAFCRELEPHGIRTAEHALDQVLLALDPGRVVGRGPGGREVERALTAAFHVDGDRELPRARLLDEEEPELEGVVVGEPLEHELPLFRLNPLPLSIHVRRHDRSREPPLDQNLRNGDSASRMGIACMARRSLCCPPGMGTSCARGKLLASFSPIANGTTSSSVPWTISTGSPIAAALDCVSNLCRTQLAGKNGTMRRAMSATEVNGDTRTNRAPKPRFAISVATPEPSD